MGYKDLVGHGENRIIASRHVSFLPIDTGRFFPIRTTSGRPKPPCFLVEPKCDNTNWTGFLGHKQGGVRVVATPVQECTQGSSCNFTCPFPILSNIFLAEARNCREVHVGWRHSCPSWTWQTWLCWWSSCGSAPVGPVGPAYQCLSFVSLKFGHFWKNWQFLLLSEVDASWCCQLGHCFCCCFFFSAFKTFSHPAIGYEFVDLLSNLWVWTGQYIQV